MFIIEAGGVRMSLRGVGRGAYQRELPRRSWFSSPAIFQRRCSPRPLDLANVDRVRISVRADRSGRGLLREEGWRKTREGLGDWGMAWTRAA